jgi:HD-GYP domain-containing protein (c-di-GMP phosphodiesterase class II)
VIPIVLSHHDKFDGSGYHPNRGDEIPIEARIISVADVYDSLTSDRPYRKAMSTFEAKEIIVKGSGTDFDPQVVNAFVDAFRKGGLEVPAVVV